jgi:uncharacterized protein (TIGR02246 family)
MKKIASIILLSLSILITTSVFAASEKSQVQAAYHTWIKAVTTADGKPSSVLNLYAPDAILLATLDPKPLLTRKALRQYFVKFTGLKDLTATTQQLITRVFPGFAINDGRYTFQYQGANGKTKTVEARFNFVYRNVDGQWLIVDHHSSVLPKP